MKHRKRRFFLYCGLIFLRLFILCLPRAAYLSLARWAGYSVYSLLRKERLKTEEHLKLAFGKSKDEKEISRIGRAVFENLAQNLVEWASFTKFNPRNIHSIVETSGLEKIRAAHACGRGVIILTAHFGNWELLGATILMYMPDVKGATVGRQIYYKRFNDLLVAMRKSKRLETLYRDESPRKMLHALKQNKLLGIVPDQDVDGVDGIFVDFFDQPAYTPTGPAALSRTARAALIPCFMIRKGNKHRLEICDPIEIDKAQDKDSAIRQATEAWTRTLEGYIRRYPEQWVWMHRRWKTKEKK